MCTHYNTGRRMPCIPSICSDKAELVCTWQAGDWASNICQAQPGGQPQALKLDLRKLALSCACVTLHR